MVELEFTRGMGSRDRGGFRAVLGWEELGRTNCGLDDVIGKVTAMIFDV